LLDARFIFADFKICSESAPKASEGSDKPSKVKKIGKCRPNDLTKIRQGVERLSCGKMIGEQHATDGLVHELGLVNRNYHAVGWYLAGLNHNFGNSLT
jgi:hypothetical protein